MKYKVFLLFLCSFSAIACSRVEVLTKTGGQRSVGILFNAPQPLRQDFSEGGKSNVRYGVQARRSAIYRQMPKMRIPRTLCGIKKYFRWLGLSEKEALERATWYVVPAFVKFVQEFDGYSEAIERLHKKLGKIGGWKKFKLFCKGQYTSGLQEVICKLNEQLQLKKQRQRLTTFEKSYDVSSDACDYLTAYNIEVSHLAHYSGTHDEHKLHDQLCSIADKATGITKSYNCPPKSNLFIDVIGDGLACGVEAHRNHKIKIAQAWVDFCWKAIDCVQAFCEGAVLGVQNTVHHLLHPIATVQNLLYSVWTIVKLLAKTVHTIGLCANAYVVDYDEFIMRKNDIVDSLTYLKDRAYEVVSTTDARTIIKHGTAFAFEAVLFKKACSVGYKAAKEIIPVVKKIVDPRVRYIVLENNEVVSLRSLARNPFKMVKELKKCKKCFERVPGVEESLRAVSQAKISKIKHVMVEKHLWNRVCMNAENWDNVKEVINVVIKKGKLEWVNYDSFKKTFSIGGKLIEVRLTCVKNNYISFANAWVIK